LRQTPGREVLIDVETSQDPQDLFKKAALNLLEHIKLPPGSIGGTIVTKKMHGVSQPLRLPEVIPIQKNTL
jgi:hypothetical protein